MYNKLKRKVKFNYYEDIFQTHKHIMKMTWKLLLSAIGRTTDKGKFPSYFTVNDKQVSDKFKIAEAFNKYFSNIGKKTSESVPISRKNYSQYLENPNPNSMFLEPVEPAQVLSIVRKLKAKTSSGHDQISTRLIKDAIDNILHPITYIINKSLENGIFPQQLKIAKVIPIFKSGENDKLNNYRPVSLLPAF